MFIYCLYGEVKGYLIFNNKRTEAEIVFDLLSSAKKDIKKTRLMYKANMPYIQFKKYLDALTKKGLIGEKDLNIKGKVYYLTENGKDLMEYLKIVKFYLK